MNARNSFSRFQYNIIRQCDTHYFRQHRLCVGYVFSKRHVHENCKTQAEDTNFLDDIKQNFSFLTIRFINISEADGEKAFCQELL